MKKIFYLRLLGLAAGQSACTFTDYAAEQGKVKKTLFVENHFESVLPCYNKFLTLKRR